MDALLDALIRFAQETLAKHGGFFPFAAAVTGTGAVEMVGGYTGRSVRHHRRLSTCSIRDLLTEHRVVRSELREFASTFDCGSATTPTLSRFSLEHASAEPVNVFLPYKRQRLDGVKYGQLFATSGEAESSPDGCVAPLPLHPLAT